MFDSIHCFSSFDALSSSCADKQVSCFNTVYTKESLLKTAADFLNEYDISTNSAEKYYKNYPNVPNDEDPFYVEDDYDEPNAAWDHSAGGELVITPEEFYRFADYVTGTLHTYGDCVESYANINGISKAEAEEALSEWSDSVSEIKQNMGKYLAMLCVGHELFDHSDKMTARIRDLQKKINSGNPRYAHERDVESDFVRTAEPTKGQIYDRIDRHSTKYPVDVPKKPIIETGKSYPVPAVVK